MLTREEAELRVARGSAHLDRVRPQWFQHVDEGTLMISSCDWCVLGQLARHDNGGELVGESLELTYTSGLGRVGLCEGGFTITEAEAGDDEGAAAFALLQDAWIAAIAARKFPVREPVSESIAAEAQPPVLR